MRNILSFIFGLLVIHVAVAQNCTISGHVNNTKDSVLVIYFLTADGNYKHQYKIIKINTNNFKESITLSRPMFVNLEFDNHRQKLLLSPNRDLHLEIEGNKEEKIAGISGKASVENILIKEHIVTNPFYIKAHSEWRDNSYAKLCEDSLLQLIMVPVTQQLNAALKKINNAEMPVHLKRLLQQEKKYLSQNQLYDFAQNYMRWAKNPAYERFLKKIGNYIRYRIAQH